MIKIECTFNKRGKLLIRPLDKTKCPLKRELCILPLCPYLSEKRGEKTYLYSLGFSCKCSNSIGFIHEESKI